jgi:MoaA/NifB/PqqE/SkfB family radical SAM enzyme
MGWPQKLPMNLTLSLSYKCNSYCKTCNIQSNTDDEFSSTEWSKVFEGLGNNPFWVTISGGEPFLHHDLLEIVCALYDYCRPGIICIPTNGILKERISKSVEQIALHCKKTRIVINVSIDEIGHRHDRIRGVPGNYQKAIASYKSLKSIHAPNVTAGIHTVISRFNVRRMREIYRRLMTFCPDSYVTEIAEEREELNTIGSDIAPDYNDYSDAVDFLIKAIGREDFSSVGKISRSFRIEYYRLAKRLLNERQQIIPCYAGFSSAQIAPNGDLWMCCTKAESIGNLRDVEYDFERLWLSEKAAELRRTIKAGECYCPLANAGYMNILHNPKYLFKTVLNLLRAN